MSRDEPMTKGDQITRLNRFPRDLSHPYYRPRDAATLIIVDRSGAEPKALFGKRHAGHAFMPGMYVFPGGRLEFHDRLMPSASDLDPVTIAKLSASTQRMTPSRARALALTAVRETFEETGLMIGVRTDQKPARVANPAWQPFADHGISPDLAALHFVARAITPPGRSRRFDTRFFAVDTTTIAHEVKDVVGPDSELTELSWVPLSDIGRLGLLPITAVVLEELESRTREGLPRDRPVPFFHVKNRRFIKEML